MNLQDLPKEKLVEIIVSINKKRSRGERKWRKLAAYYRDAFMNACHNQMEVVQENKEMKEIIKRHIKQ